MSYKKSFKGRTARGILLTVAIAVVSSSGVYADFEPAFMPGIQTDRTSTSIDIDGVLDETGWQTAGRVDQFSERSPGDNTEPLADTEAYITYDNENIYVAFVCNDDPDEVRATMCPRDGYFNDDAVGVFIDTYGDATWAYQFYVNPYGIQKDLMWTAVHGTDRGFDMIWQSAAKITPDGYVVEMAIPIAGMRFPGDMMQDWRIDFRRIHPRESYRQYSWAAYDRDEQCEPCQWGSVSGISGIQPGKGLEIMPAFVASQGGRADAADPERPLVDDNYDFRNDDITGKPSIGAKFSLSSDVTMEATLNPDFSQVEADAGQININSTIALQYPERRPFFQEGNDLFRTPFNSFYTRTVNAPEFAAKGTARFGSTSMAYLAARDGDSPYMIPTEERSFTALPGKSTVNVLRGLHSMGTSSRVGFMVTDRRFDRGGSGSIVSADANIRLSSNFSWMLQAVGSHTREPEGISVSADRTFDGGKYTVDLDGESYYGNALVTQLRRRSRAWNITMDYNQVSPSYQTQTGYDPWNNQRNAYIFTNYQFYPEGGIFERISPSLFTNARWNYENVRKWIHYTGSLNFNLRHAQTFVGLGGRTGSELWSGTEFDDLWSVNMNAGTRPFDQIGGFLFVRYGKTPARESLKKGNETTVSMELDLKPFDRLQIEPTLDYVRSKGPTGEMLYEQTVARVRMALQVNQRLSLRLVLQNNRSLAPGWRDEALAGNFDTYHMHLGSKWEIDPLLTYRINSFSLFYIGSTHDYRDFNVVNDSTPSHYRMTDRQYFMKLQYLFQM